MGDLERGRGTPDQPRNGLAVAARDERDRRIAALRLAGAARRADDDVTGAQTSPRLPALARSSPRSRPASPARDEPPRSTAAIFAGRSSAAWIVAALSFSAYGGLRVAKSSVSSSTPPRTASRAASTASDTASSS